MSEAALDVFIQALLARLVPLVREVILGAHLLLKPETATALCVVAGAGALVAGGILYAIGRIMRRLLPHISTLEQQARTELKPGVMALLPYLLLLAPLRYFGLIFVVANGFYNIPLRKAVPLLVAGEIAFRYFLLTTLR